jgi:hypothetical protein
MRAAAGLDQGQERRGMGAADPGRLRHPVQALGRVLPDRLQHRVPRRRRSGARRHLPQQALVDEFGHTIEHRQAHVHSRATDAFDDFQAGAAREYRACAE